MSACEVDITFVIMELIKSSYYICIISLICMTRSNIGLILAGNIDFTFVEPPLAFLLCISRLNSNVHCSHICSVKRQFQSHDLLRFYKNSRALANHPTIQWLILCWWHEAHFIFLFLEKKNSRCGTEGEVIYGMRFNVMQ